MKTRPVALALAAALAGASLLLVAGPAGLTGSADASPRAATPTRCAAYDAAPSAVPSTTPSSGTSTASGFGHSTRELQDRLARTPPGGTLTVQPGIYRGALVIDRAVTIVGVGHPVIRGDGTGTVLTIRAPGTTVRGLVIEGSGPGPVGEPSGVKVEADNVVVQNLRIRDTYTGIRVDGVRDAKIIGNVIEGRKALARKDTQAGGSATQAGIDTKAAADMADMSGMDMSPGKSHAQGGRGDAVILFNAIRPVVAGNSVADARDGVYLSFGRGSRIECNSIVGSRYALHSMYGGSVTVAGNTFAANLSGPVMMYGGPVTLEDNVIRDQHSASTGYGVLLLDVGGARLLRNIIVSNRVGIQIEGEQESAVELNTIGLNQVGVALYPTARSVLSQNSMVENTIQALGMGPDGGGGDSAWSRDGVGNFWSNYRGYDRSGDGVGDISHVEGAAAGRLLAGDPVLLALASSPAFNLLRAVEQRSAAQRPVALDPSPLVDPRSPSLPPAVPSTAGQSSFGTGLVGAVTLAVCSLALLRCTGGRRPTPETTRK